MRPLLLLGLPALFAASPALATGGFDCRTTDGTDIRLTGVVGHTITAPLVGAALHLDGATWSTTDPQPRIAIGRSWIDSRETRVDLVDPNATRFAAQLRVRHTARGTATGTLVRNDVTHPVRCTLE